MDFPPIIRGGKAPPLLNSTQQDVGAQIVGGDPVDPPRKYKVRTTLCHRVKTFAASYADFDYSVNFLFITSSMPGSSKCPLLGLLPAADLSSLPMW